VGSVGGVGERCGWQVQGGRRSRKGCDHGNVVVHCLLGKGCGRNLSLLLFLL